MVKYSQNKFGISTQVLEIFYPKGPSFFFSQWFKLPNNEKTFTSSESLCPARPQPPPLCLESHAAQAAVLSGPGRALGPSPTRSHPE